MEDIKQDVFSIWSNATPVVFQVKNQDADIKVSFWDLGKKLTWEGGHVVPCKGQMVSIHKQKTSPPFQLLEKKNQTKLMEIDKSITQRRHLQSNVAGD